MNKKSAILFSALFLSVAIAGVAYAHWLEIITIDGFVQTGTLELVPSIEVKYEQEKPVAVVDYGMVEQDSDSMFLNFFNVYPCFSATGRITLTNTGTVPAGLEEFRLKIYEDAGDFTWVVSSHPDYQYYMVLMNDGDGQEALQLGVNFDASEHQYDGAPPNSVFQIDPKQSAWMDFYIHFDEGIPESEMFWLEAEVEYWNWNEAAGEAFNFVYEVVDGPGPTVPVPPTS